MMGFTKIDVIDMDTIDISNLNRQFLFTDDDIGKPKAEVAASFINDRVAGCNVTPHFAKIQDFDMDFYKRKELINLFLTCPLLSAHICFNPFSPAPTL
ncbi:NEDD8-activating enzyme E1 catalytic subunit [Geodia barretti]|nr:NEDD8-activating enzyme E1 catalytic subunit [Geodia barretti]